MLQAAQELMLLGGYFIGDIIAMETERTTVIYRLYHLPSGKCYIGQTMTDFEARFANHWTKWARAYDPRKENWLMASVVKLLGVQAQSKEAHDAEQIEIDKFVAEFGIDLLLNKNTNAQPASLRRGNQLSQEHTNAIRKAISKPFALYAPTGELIQCYSKYHCSELTGLSTSSCHRLQTGLYKNIKGYKLE